MTPLLALTLVDVAPLIVFVAIVAGAWFLMSALTRRATLAEERLARLGRPQSLADGLEPGADKQRFKGLADAIASIGAAAEGKSDLEKNRLKLQLTNAGFRSDNAPMIYQGLRILTIILFLIPTAGLMLYFQGFTQKALFYIVILGGVAFYLPQVALYLLVSSRKKQVFLTLPDALDLVAAGRGYLPVPRLLVDTVVRPDIRFVPLDDSGLRMTYALVWCHDRASAEVMALVQAVQELLRTRS